MRFLRHVAAAAAVRQDVFRVLGAMGVALGASVARALWEASP